MKNLNYKNIEIFISEKSDGSMKLLNDSADNDILVNRKNFFEKIGIDSENVVSANLVHGSNVEIVGNENKGDFIEKTDGLITKEKGVFLTMTVADCLPIFLWTKNGDGVGILHAGWRSIIGGIIEEGIEKLRKISGCKAEEICLKIGPSIGSCCFEVDENLLKKFEEFSDAINVKNDKKYINLQEVVKQIAFKKGLLEENIDIDCVCTSCLSEKYFSYRRDKPEKVQAMVAGIGIL